MTAELDESVATISRQLASYEEMYKRKWGEELSEEYNFATFYEKRQKAFQKNIRYEKLKARVGIHTATNEVKMQVLEKMD